MHGRHDNNYRADPTEQVAKGQRGSAALTQRDSRQRQGQKGRTQNRKCLRQTCGSVASTQRGSDECSCRHRTSYRDTAENLAGGQGRHRSPLVCLHCACFEGYVEFDVGVATHHAPCVRALVAAPMPIAQCPGQPGSQDRAALPRLSEDHPPTDRGQ